MCTNGAHSDHSPLSALTALYPRAASSPISVDLPVPDMPVRSTLINRPLLHLLQRHCIRGPYQSPAASVHMPYFGSRLHFTCPSTYAALNPSMWRIDVAFIMRGTTLSGFAAIMVVAEQ